MAKPRQGNGQRLRFPVSSNYKSLEDRYDEDSDADDVCREEGWCSPDSPTETRYRREE